GLEIYEEDGTRSDKKIDAWIKKHDFVDWLPTPKSGKPCTQGDYLKKLVAYLSDENQEAADLIRQLLDLFEDVNEFNSPPCGIAPDGRTHADQGPFGAASGRNAAKKFILNARKWWRWLITPVKGTAIINFDFSGEDPAAAAYLSGDEGMIAAYEAGDI